MTAGGQVWQPYLRGNLWRDWGAEADAVYSGTDLVPLASQITRLELGGGLTGRINANVSVFANVDYEFAVGASEGENEAAFEAHLARSIRGEPPSRPHHLLPSTRQVPGGRSARSKVLKASPTSLSSRQMPTMQNHGSPLTPWEVCALVHFGWVGRAGIGRG